MLEMTMQACPTCGKPTSLSLPPNPTAPLFYGEQEEIVPFGIVNYAQVASAPLPNTPVQPAEVPYGNWGMPQQMGTSPSNVSVFPAEEGFANMGAPTPQGNSQQSPNMYFGEQSYPYPPSDRQLFDLPQAPEPSDIYAPYGPAQAIPVQPQKRRGISAGLTVLIVVLVLAIIAGGSGLVYYAAVVRPAQMNAQATTTAQQATTTAQNTVATRTAAVQQANAQATATANALTPQDLLTQVTSGTPTLSDSLSSTSSNGWQSFGSGFGSCTYGGGALHLKATPGVQGSFCAATSTNFGDFAYQVKMTIIHGVAGGIIFRADLGQGIYFFALLPAQKLYVLAAVQGTNGGLSNEKVLATGVSDAINTGTNQPNVLTVIARGSDIVLYLNGQYATRVNDSSASTGFIGMIALNTGNQNIDIAFSNAQVWGIKA
jgi:Flp pilus assembly protein TadG